MVFLYKKQANPQNRTAPGKWYGSLKSIGLRKKREIALLAADGTTLDPKEAELTYSRLGKVVIQSLLDGHTVEIPCLGTFRLTANSDGADTKEELTANQIRTSTSVLCLTKRQKKH